MNDQKIAKLERLVRSRLTRFFTSRKIYGADGIIGFEMRLKFKNDAELDHALKQLAEKPSV